MSGPYDEPVASQTHDIPTKWNEASEAYSDAGVRASTSLSRPQQRINLYPFLLFSLPFASIFIPMAPYVSLCFSREKRSSSINRGEITLPRPSFRLRTAVFGESYVSSSPLDKDSPIILTSEAPIASTCLINYRLLEKEISHGVSLCQ